MTMEPNTCKCGCGAHIRKESTWAKGHNPNKTKDRHDWSNLAQDYAELKSSVKVAEKYGCSHKAVLWQLKKRGISALDQKIEIENVEELYDQVKSLKKVADIVGCAPITVGARLRESGRTLSHDNKNLDLPVGLGRHGELIALSLLKGSIDLNLKNMLGPYDIKWKGLKIDVKTSRIRNAKKGKPYHSFSAVTGGGSHFLCVALDENDALFRLLLIPVDRVKGVSITYRANGQSPWEAYRLPHNAEDIEKAYYEKNNINYARLESGY